MNAEIAQLIDFAKSIEEKIKLNNETAFTLKRLFIEFYQRLAELVDHYDLFEGCQQFGFGNSFVLVSYNPCTFDEHDIKQLKKDYGENIDKFNMSKGSVEQKKNFEIIFIKNKNKTIDVQLSLYQKRMVNLDGLSCNYYATMWENDYAYDFRFDSPLTEQCDRLIKDMTLYDFILCKDYMKKLCHEIDCRI